MFSRTFSGKPKTYIMDVIGTCLYSDGSTMLITIERLKTLVRGSDSFGCSFSADTPSPLTARQTGGHFFFP